MNRGEREREREREREIILQHQKVCSVKDSTSYCLLLALKDNCLMILPVKLIY